MQMRIKSGQYLKWVANAAATRLGLKLFSVNLEVTKKCNARCNFCDYWKTREEQALEDYLPIIQHLDPLSVTITGGEPLLRKDIANIIGGLKSNLPLIRLSMITNGIALSEGIADSLFNAGLDQLSISLDFLDERHDRNRGSKGLFQHINDIAPKIRSKGHNLCLNTVVMKDNSDHLPEIVSWANKNQIDVGFSCYSDLKNMNKKHLVPEAEIAGVKNSIADLLDLKKSYGNVLNSEFYLKNIPLFFEKKDINGCQAGMKWVQVTPEGHIKRCSEHRVKCHWTEYDRSTFDATHCGRCWFACRGESQAPFQLSRLSKYARFLISNLK